MQTNPTRMRRRGSRPRVSPRRWCIPSAILRSPGEKLNGISILEEVPDSAGLLLWLTLDDITLWATSPPGTRERLAGLCSPKRLAILGSGTPADLRYALELLSAILSAPGDADAEVLGVACLSVASWARQGGHRRTALAFAQVGALAAPLSPDAALQTGICAQEVHESIRAETWLRRTVAVARRAGDWDAYSSAYMLLGMLQLSQDRLTEAKDSLGLAFRTARRLGIANVRRDAAHGLFRVALTHALAADADSPNRNAYLVEADMHAAAAYRAHTVEQADTSAMLLDVARHWITRGDAEQALGPLARLRSISLATQDDALRVAAMTARAHAAARRGKTAGRAADERAFQMLSSQSISEEAAFSAAVDLAHAAVERRDRTAFDRARGTALRFAPNAEYEATIALLATLAYAWAPPAGGDDGEVARDDG